MVSSATLMDLSYYTIILWFYDCCKLIPLKIKWLLHLVKCSNKCIGWGAFYLFSGSICFVRKQISVNKFSLFVFAKSAR